jgi:hypothetical protein
VRGRPETKKRHNRSFQNQLRRRSIGHHTVVPRMHMVWFANNAVTMVAEASSRIDNGCQFIYLPRENLRFSLNFRARASSMNCQRRNQAFD